MIRPNILTLSLTNFNALIKHYFKDGSFDINNWSKYDRHNSLPSNIVDAADTIIVILGDGVNTSDQQLCYVMKAPNMPTGIYPMSNVSRVLREHYRA